MKRSVSAFIGTFLATLIVFGTVAGCMLADRRTATMTFGTDERPLTDPDTSWDSSVRSTLQTVAAWMPLRVRIGLLLEQYECQVVADWIDEIFS